MLHCPEALILSQSVDWLAEGFRILKKAAVIGSFFVPGFLQLVAERGLGVPFFSSANPATASPRRS